MEVVFIKLAEIDCKDRMRPADQEAVQCLAADINERGLRSPIEVAKKSKGGFRLVAGYHRLTAYQLLDLDKIPAFIRTGNLTELKRDELLENLARRDLSALERAQFIKKLKDVFVELNGTQHGGDRKSDEYKGENQPATLANWFEQVSSISGKGIRTLERSASIGEKLSSEAAEKLRGTPFEDNQKQLEALSKLSPEEQLIVADMMTLEYSPAKSVSEAKASIDGRVKEKKPKKQKADQWLDSFKDIWAKAPSDSERQHALKWLVEAGEISPIGIAPVQEASE